MPILKHTVNIFKKIGFSLGSSHWLAQSLVKYSQINNHDNIKVLELGAGYGNVTREIVKKAGKRVSITAIEQCEDCIDSLKSLSHPQLTIIHGDVRKLGEYVEDESIDIIISTLPLGSFDKELANESLVNMKKALKKGGKYIQFQYWMANKSDVKKYFHIDTIKLEPRNFTPAFIYVTHKE